LALEKHHKIASALTASLQKTLEVRAIPASATAGNFGVRSAICGRKWFEHDRCSSHDEACCNREGVGVRVLPGANPDKRKRPLRAFSMCRLIMS
jgi:hypothetical protein